MNLPRALFKMSPLFAVLNLLLFSPLLAPPVQASVETLCGVDRDKAHADFASFIQKLNIETMRGNIEAMRALHAEFLSETSQYGTCARAKGVGAEEQKRQFIELCGIDCHISIGRYYVFMASQLIYFPSVEGADSPIKIDNPADSDRQANEGVEFLKMNRGLLVGQLPPSDSQNGTARLRNYLFDLARYQLIMAQLQMAAGDAHYRALSESRLQKLLKDVFGATREISDSNLERNSVRELKARYENALWIIAEAFLGLPDEVAFGGIRADFIALKNDLTERLQSADNGLLYIGIDPDEFSIFTVSKLRVEVAELANRVESIEQRVERLLQSWLEVSAAQKSQNVDEQRYQQNQSQTMSAYRIAQLEEMSASFKTDIEAQRSAISAKQGEFQFEEQRRRLEIELEMKLAALMEEQRAIQSQKEIQVLDFKVQSARERIGNVRWLMNWKIAQNSLALQLSSLDDQLIQHEREKNENASKLAQIELKKLGLSEQIEIAKEAKIQSDARIENLEDQRGKIFVERMRSFKEQICQQELRIKFLGAPVTNPLTDDNNSPLCNDQLEPVITTSEYHAQVCGTQQAPGIQLQLQEQRIRSRAVILKCVIGSDDLPSDARQTIRDVLGQDPDVSCPANIPTDQTLKETMQSIVQNELKLADQQAEETHRRLERLRAQVSTLGNNLEATIRDRSIYQTTLTGLGTAMILTSKLPDVGVVAGPGGGPVTLINKNKSAAAAYHIFRDMGSLKLTIDEYKRTNAQSVANLQDAIEVLRAEIKLEPLKKSIRELHLNKALLEIGGREVAMSNEIRELALGLQSSQLNCQSEGKTLDENIALAKSRHEQLMAQRTAARFSNDTLDNDIEIELSRQSQSDSNIEIAELQIDQLEIEAEAAKNDLELIDDLIEGVNDRKRTIHTLNRELAGLETEESAERQALEQLDKARQELILSEKDRKLSYVQDVIRNEKSQTQELLDVINAQEELFKDDTKLQDRLLAFQADTQTLVSAERENMMNTLESSNDSGDKERIFLSAQEEIAKFVKGAPVYIENKRRLMERANRMLHLLRARVGVLTRLTGDTADELEISFVRTSDKLREFDTLLSDRTVWSRAPVITEMSRIVVPRASGLARELALRQRAKFEISPFARNRMADLGYFSLWSSDFDPDEYGLSQSMMLVDFRIGVYFSLPGCRGRRYVLKSDGSGHFFKEASANDANLLPSFLTSAERRAISTYVSLADEGENRLQQIHEFWSRDHYLHNFLGEGTGPPNDPNANMPLMGVPLISSYELVLPPAPEGCDYEDSSFVFYPIYSKTVRTR